MNYEKLVYKYAYDNVDSWDLDTLIEYAETAMIAKGLDKLKENPEAMIAEMKEFWEVDDLSEINPDDFKA